MNSTSTYKGLKINYLTNRLGVKHPYIVEYGITLSGGERKVEEALLELKVPYVREVSFINFKTPKGGHYRFDFLLHKHAIILEYDGKRYHSTNTQKENDKIKNKFCRDNAIKLYRFSGTDYYNMKTCLLEILLQRKPYNLTNNSTATAKVKK